MEKIINLIKENLSLLNILKQDNISTKRYEVEFQHRLSKLTKDLFDFLVLHGNNENIMISNNHSEYSFEKTVKKCFETTTAIENWLDSGNITNGFLKRDLEKLLIKYYAVNGIMLLIKSNYLKNKIKQD